MTPKVKRVAEVIVKVIDQQTEALPKVEKREVLQEVVRKLNWTLEGQDMRWDGNS